MTNIEREQLAAAELSKANLSDKFSMRRAFLLGYDLANSQQVHRVSTIQDFVDTASVDNVDALCADFTLFLKAAAQHNHDHPDDNIEYLAFDWVNDGLLGYNGRDTVIIKHEEK